MNDPDDFNEEDLEEISDDEIIELDDMIVDGQVWALCPKCGVFILSAFDEKCFYCGKKININLLIVKFINWEKSN